MSIGRRSFIQAAGLTAAGLAFAGLSNNAYSRSRSTSTKASHVNQIPLQGVVPAALTPFNSDMKVSRKEFRKHIKKLSGTKGVTAILVNGGAGEISALSREERRSLVAEATSLVGDKTPIIAGLQELDGHSMAAMAKDAEAEGAKGLMIMPPRDQESATWEKANTRHSEVFNVTDLPMVIFHTIYSNETLTKLAALPQVFAIKEGSRSPFEFESNIRSIKALDKDVAIWSTHTEWFLSDLALGADGILSAMGSFAAELHVALVDAMHRNDLAAARDISDRLFPLSQAIRHSCYDHKNFAYAVMKYALVKMGQLDNAFVRPPHKLFTDTKLQKSFDKALSKSGLLHI